ncbi:hypothetical protein H6G04_17430 [Calothrix membranacea FACHB-236]|nr:hypothetical protein [Calothrix membranacea FACHB-236]
MSSTLQSEIGVSPSGLNWDIDNFRLWESTQADVILYIPLQPKLAINLENQRYQVGVSIFHQWQASQDNITGGHVNFTLTTKTELSPQAWEELQAKWLKEITKQGYSGSLKPKFLPLPIRQLTAQILLDPQIGQVKQPGENNTTPDHNETCFLWLDLTAKGGVAWEQGLKLHPLPAADVQLEYEYPQLLPAISARIHVDGKRVYHTVTAVLKLGKDGYYYGDASQIKAAWENAVKEKAIDVELIGTLPAELEATRQNLVNNFIEQTRQRLFTLLFSPQVGTVSPSEKGDNSTIYILQWQKDTDTLDLTFQLRVEGWTWLKGYMNTDINTLFQNIDSNYINTVYQETSFPINVTVQGNPMISNVAISLSASEGKSPEALVFGSTGGTKEFLATSRKPEDVTITYQAKVSFTSATWPVLETRNTATVAQGGNRIILQPGKWIDRLKIYFFIREGNEIQPLAELDKDDYLVVNVSYQGQHLQTPIKESSRINSQEVMEFVFPLDPKGSAGQLKLSVLGLINKKMLRSSQQNINADERNVYILVSKDTIQLVSKESVISEDDELAQRLLENQAHPSIEIQN